MACNWPHMPGACGCPVSTLHDVITLVDEGAELPAAHPEPAPRLNIERLLELRGIAFDVATEHLTGEAHQAASAAVAGAAALAIQTPHVAAVSDVVTDTVAGHVLSLAGDVIRERGWTQGMLHDDLGAVCTLSAIRIASNRLGVDANDVAEVLAQRLGASIPQWNDRHGRTIHDVLAVLR